MDSDLSLVSKAFSLTVDKQKFKSTSPIHIISKLNVYINE